MGVTVFTKTSRTGTAMFYMRHRDEITGQRKERSTGVAIATPGEPTKAERRKAEQVAGAWHSDIENGRYIEPRRVSWEDFRTRFEDEHVRHKSASYAVTMASALNTFEALTGVSRLAQITPALISRFRQRLHEPVKPQGRKHRSDGPIPKSFGNSTMAGLIGLSIIQIRRLVKEGDIEAPPVERRRFVWSKGDLARVQDAAERRGWTSATKTRSAATIRSYLKHLKAALNWAHGQGLLVNVPTCQLPRESGAKGGALTELQYRQLLATVPKARPHDAQVWEQFITALWLSGLRLDEALRLSWSPDDGFSIDESGERPMFRIAAGSQKSRRDELLPSVPEFWTWLSSSPLYFRRGLNGRVFQLGVNRDQVGRIISAIGRRAGIITARTADDRPKYATAHDLRRSFGTRWSLRVNAATLQKLMRHSDIKTTMRYYVEHDARELADVIWQQHGAAADTGS